MKAGVNNSSRRLDRVADESILTAFPRRRFYPFVVALDVLIKLGAVAAINRVVCWECEVQWLRLAAHYAENWQRARQARNMLHDIAWLYFSAGPIRRQSFFISSMSLGGGDSE